MPTQIVVDTASRRGVVFRITEYNGRLTVSDYNKKKVGETKTLEQALALIKSHVGEEIRNTKIT